MNMKPSSFEKDIFFATVRISISQKNIAGSSIGTGFLFRVPLVADRAAILLVSNKHVYGDINRRLELTLHKRISKDIDEPDIGNTFTIKENDFKKAYTEHPDPSIDLACVNVSVIGEKSLCAYYRHLTKHSDSEDNPESYV